MNKLIIFALFVCFTFGQESAAVDAINSELDSLNIEFNDTIPAQRPDIHVETLPMTGEKFYDVKSDVKNLQDQIDSLKYLLKIFDKKQTIPTISEELLNLAQSQNIDHRITLENGTVILGKLISQTDVQLILQTSIGRLVIENDKVLKIDEYFPSAPYVEFVKEPEVKVYPEMEVITGTVKNSGSLRADFVRVIANLWNESTDLTFQDSSFVNGQKIKYNSGVFTDTSLEPGETATFKVILNVKGGTLPVSYRTYDTRWTVVK